MSRDWLTGMVKDPGHERFYGSKNDGMPAHYKSADDCLMREQEIDTLVDMVEPYLLKIGFLMRTKRGRMASQSAATHLGLKLLSTDNQETLF